MNIETGLFDHMVVQRNNRNVSDAAFSGLCQSAGVLKARVTRGKQVVKGFNWAPVGKARKGKFTGQLTGLRVGGPYAVELRIESSKGDVLEKMKVADLLVGDVWILGGQSNMEGCGLLAYAARPHPKVRAFFMDDRWGVAKDRLHNVADAVDQIHADLAGGQRPAPNTVIGVGPGVSFGQEMLRLSGVPQGLIACAHGGTSMMQWDPKLKQLGGKSLYGAMVRRFRKNGAKVAGAIWYQGCSDAFPVPAPLYTKRMDELVRSMRRDFANKNMPLAAVQISRVAGWESDIVHWNSIQDQQRRLPQVIANCTVVPAIDLELEDPIHLRATAQHRLGRRLAAAMWTLLGGAKATKPPIALDRVRVELDKRRGKVDLVLEFKNVVGNLQPAGGADGFAIVKDGCKIDTIFRTDLHRHTVTLRTMLTMLDMTPCRLFYGWGFNPFCNITDSADRSLPAMGPLPFGRPRAVGSRITTMSVSKMMPSAGNLKDLPYPSDLAALEMTSRTFPAFCTVRPEFVSRGRQGALAYFSCRIRCDEPMKLQAWLGYDGPVKMWIDGQERFHDSEGTNPAKPDDAKVPFQADAGEHEIIVALDSNQGRASGIFLTFERTDVPQSILRKGPAHYLMPQIV